MGSASEPVDSIHPRCDDPERHHRGGDRREAMPRPQRSPSLMVYPGRSQTQSLGASLFFGADVLGPIVRSAVRRDQRCAGISGAPGSGVHSADGACLDTEDAASHAKYVLLGDSRDSARVGIRVIRSEAVDRIERDMSGAGMTAL